MTELLGLILFGFIIVGVILSDYFDYLTWKDFFKSLEDRK